MFLFFFNDTATTEIYTLSLHDALPISRATAPSAMTKSTYSRPRASHTRAPSARTWRWGSAGSGSPPSTPSPNNASGRLLPVDVKPGTRQSFTVFPDLDGHRA